MKLKLFLVAALSLLFYSYCYSETIQTQSTNAASNGLSWTMSNILPAYTGLTVNAVKYTYTTVKVTEDNLIVSVQNLDITGNTYLLNSVDNWSKLPGNTITKTIPINNILGNLWGNGQIKKEGTGEILDPYILYSYTYDTCSLKPVTDPKCPNYKPFVPDIKIIEDSIFALSYKESQEDIDNKNNYFLSNVDLKSKPLNKTATNKLESKNSKDFFALNNIPGFSLYSRTISGGVYNDILKYPDKKLPDNYKGRRLTQSQEQLHNSLVNLQYK